jgi:hypothetical protein
MKKLLALVGLAALVAGVVVALRSRGVASGSDVATARPAPPARPPEELEDAVLVGELDDEADDED